MPDKSATVAQASGARSGSGSGASTRTPPESRSLSVLLDVTALTGLGTTLTVSVQWSHDGVVFAPADPADGFAALTGAGKVVKSFAIKGEWFRLAWTITGTGPSVTFAATAYGV